MTEIERDLIIEQCNKLFLNKFILQVNHSLFHYTSLDKAQSILSSKEMWMKHYQHFLDKKEFFHGMDLILSILKIECARNTMFKEYYGAFFEFLDIEMRSPQIQMYVMCFCKTNKNKYLTRKYTKNGTPCVVEFSFHEDDVGLQPVFLKVIYSKKRFEKLAKNLFYNYADYLYRNREDSNFKTSSFMAALIKDLYILAISLKRKEFKIEDEIRAVKFDGAPPNLIFKEKITNSFIKIFEIK